MDSLGGKNLEVREHMFFKVFTLSLTRCSGKIWHFPIIFKGDESFRSSTESWLCEDHAQDANGTRNSNRR